MTFFASRENALQREGLYPIDRSEMLVETRVSLTSSA